MLSRLRRLRRDETGTTTIEFAIVMLLFLLLTFGLVELGNMFWQYNSAAKAVQLGARLAAVSNPLSPDLLEIEDAGTPGGPWTTDYTIICDSDGCDDGSYDAAAMNCLVYGRSETDPPCDDTCEELGIDGDVGMCDRYSAIGPENVEVTYTNTGLGFAGRPGGPVPTITVRLTGLQFQFYVLGDLLGLDPVAMPPFTVTVTGEDLSRLAP